MSDGPDLAEAKARLRQLHDTTTRKARGLSHRRRQDADTDTSSTSTTGQDGGSHTTSWRERLGPGLATDAADDEPNGFATFSQVGAKFGYAMLWIVFLTVPLMIATQTISVRVGRRTGRGLTDTLSRSFPRFTGVMASGGLIISTMAHAGAGAYLVDDASITPEGRCQVQSWAQLVSGGQKTLNALPACTTGSVEWSLGLAAQNHPFEHQESPAVKWMIRDPDHYRLGFAVNVGLTLANGHILSRNSYVAATLTPDDARRWAINADLGEIYARGTSWRTLTGLGVKYKLREQLALVAERIQPWNGDAINQLGMRWTFHNKDSFDVIVGKSDAHAHDRWLTFGLNWAL